jgi:hypothetical protein
MGTRPPIGDSYHIQRDFPLVPSLKFCGLVDKNQRWQLTLLSLLTCEKPASLSSLYQRSLHRVHVFALPLRQPGTQRITVILATQFVRKMRGASHAVLLRCSDRHYYVVKLQGNPHHTRVLANEYLASKLASHLGLPVPEVDIVEVDQRLVEHSLGMIFEKTGALVPMKGGLHVGSRYVICPCEGQVFDYFPEDMLPKVRNIDTFAGVLAFDLWTSNLDPRQAVFWKTCRERLYRVSFVDQESCFGAAEWRFGESTKIGLYIHKRVYRDVIGWGNFEPYLSRIENVTLSDIERIARQIPEGWYGEWEQLFQLIEELCQRRTAVRGLLLRCRQGNPAYFPNWRDQAAHHQPGKGPSSEASAAYSTALPA